MDLEWTWIVLHHDNGSKVIVRSDRLREYFEAQGEDRPFVKRKVRRPYTTLLL